MPLELASEGCCVGHKCDNCATCRKGRCCRRDTPDYRLPGLGEWDGPIYGELGVLNDDGDKVECHCCGKWFALLITHIYRIHNLTAREYKSIFGLNLTDGLCSRASSAKRAAYHSHLTRIRPTHVSLSDLTAEQLSAIASRPKSVQARRSFRERAIRTAPLTHTEEARAKISTAARQRWEDPSFKESMSRALNDGRKKHPLSPESRARISAHRTAYWEQQKARGVGVSSRFYGVSWNKDKQKWVVQGTWNHQRFYAGSYLSEEEAARAYDAKARELYGDAARLNFPDGAPA